ncbi:TonB-dependent receptor plug domain-containing protein, partial [Paraglaciecola sp.]|uniref:TonB-dependent receptor plug domain-containing protein n=1 Tax=Paraglaciecola sp. TaxID=1920173 RepID=UPI003F4A888C
MHLNSYPLGKCNKPNSEMKEIAVKPHTKKKPLNIIFKKSRSSLLIMSALCTAYSGITYSQETDNKDAKETDETEVIEVKGMRSNISAAQHLKRHANTVIDSITAEDIGDFPDKSVAEALQRVPGITVERFGSRTDTKAFSVEPSGVLVRGLGFVRSEFNGRDSFSANSSRGLSWGDVSPELMGGVDVYKSQTAELIEGGIAGLINLKTRLPFDSENDYKVLTVRGNYSDLSESTTPEISGIYTTRMNTDVGEFGFMANMAYSKVDATAQTSRVSRMIKYRGVYGDNEDELHYIPDNFNASDDLYSRTRLGASLAAQWQSNEADKLVTLQYNRSEKDQDRAQSGISAGLGNPFFQKSLLLEATPTGDGSDKIPAAADGTDPFTFDERGFFQTGRLVAPSTWRGKDNAASALRAMNSEGQALLNNCAGAWAGCDPVDYTGTGMTTNGGFSTRNNITEDYGLNFKWHLTDEIHTNFDLQYVESTEDWYSLTTTLSSYTDPDVDLTGDEIKLVFHEPTNVNLLDSGQGIYANPNSYRLDNIMDMYGDSEGTELAARADIVFDVYNEVVERVKFGVRYADREQQVNNGFNWASVVNTWSDNTAPFYNLDSAPTTGEFNGNPYTFNGFPQSWEIKEWESTYGDFTTADGMNLFVVPDPVAMQNWRNTMGASTIGAPTSAWEPICSGLGNRSIEVDGGCFTPVEMIDISEESKAAYVQIDFGGDDFTLFGKQLSGNLGIRYVETEVYSSGGEAYPSMDDTLLICKDREESEDPEAPPQEITKSLGCYLKAEDIAFSNNGNIAGEASTSYSHVLPS